MRRLLVACAGLALAGCAAVVAPASRPPAHPPAAAAHAATPADSVPVPGPTPAQARTQAHAQAPSDSGPSPEARRVLATIPEPVPAGSPPDTQAVAAPAGADTARAAAPDTSSVPVPAPVAPLGDTRTTAPALPTVVEPPPPPPAAARPDTCWRVQVGAPADRVKGKRLRDAAESVLLVPMIADHEGGRWKVRSRDCLSREAAEAVLARARSSGFKGVFLVHTQEARR